MRSTVSAMMILLPDEGQILRVRMAAYGPLMNFTKVSSGSID